MLYTILTQYFKEMIVENDKWTLWLADKGLSEEEIQSVRPYILPAKVRIVDTDEEFLIIASGMPKNASEVFKTAGIDEELLEAGPSLVVDGKPRMLHLSAFIAHEGFNNNNDGFIADELKAIVNEGNLFQGSYAGIIDHHHDLDPIGYWYDAEYAFDPLAQKYGILAHGAIWAWRFQEIADKLLAEQVREGTVAVSMACLSKDVEHVDDGGKGKDIIHNPTFIAASVLTDFPPADFYSRTIIEDEGSKTSKEDRAILIRRTATLDPDETEDLMEIKEVVTALLEALGERDSDITATVTQIVDDKFSEIKSSLSASADALVAAEEQITDLEANVVELGETAEEKNLAFEALREDKEGLDTKVEGLEEELRVYHEAEEGRALEEVKATRLNQLNATTRAKLDKLSDEKQESIMARWASLTDEEWESRMEELNLGGSEKKEGDLPEGVLPNTPASKEGSNGLDRFLNK